MVPWRMNHSPLSSDEKEKDLQDVKEVNDSQDIDKILTSKDLRHLLLHQDNENCSFRRIINPHLVISHAHGTI